MTVLVITGTGTGVGKTITTAALTAAARQAGVDVAKAQLANILVGTRVEVVDQKKAALQSAQANFQLADKTYARIKDLAGTGNAPLQRLDEATNSLEVAAWPFFAMAGMS